MSAGGRSRAAALALLTGIVVIAGAALVVPIGLYWSKTGAIIENARSKVQRAEQRSDARNALADSRFQWNSFITSEESGFVLSNNDEAAIDATEARIETMFGRFGGSSASITVNAEDGPRDGVRSIVVSTTGTIPRANLGEFLTTLESTAPYLIVSEFSARKANANNVRINITARAFRLLEPST